MHRGQSSVEYSLLLTALMLGVCLLVRFSTPVGDLAGEVAGAIARPVVHAPAAAPRRVGSIHRHHHRPPAPHRCLCPAAAAGRLPASS